MEKKILLRTLVPLAMIGAVLSVTLPLTSCSCNNNNDQPIINGYLIDGSNWQGYTQGHLTFNRDTVNHTVSYIGYSADYTATDLVIPDTVYDVDGVIYTVNGIGNTAFQNCANLFGTLRIGDNVTTIGYNAFYSCYNLTSLITGNNIATIGDKAFYGCIGLIDTSGSIVANKISQSGDNVYYIYNGSIYYCLGKYDNVKSTGTKPSGQLNLLPNTKVLSDEAFYNCNGLTGNLVIPNTIIDISYLAFMNCSGLTGTLTIPNTITSIERQAFFGATGFTGNLTIPNSVTSIGNGSFRGSANFTGTLTFGNSVASIARVAFEGCTGFTSITGNFSGEPVIDSDAFNRFNNTVGGTVHNNNPSYSSATLLTLLKTKGLPDNWVVA